MPTIAVFGASGLLGQSVATLLKADGFPVVPVARRFTSAQSAAFGMAVQAPIVDLGPDELARLLSEHKADVVVNCVGVLQDSSRSGSAEDAHSGFAGRLAEAMLGRGGPRLLVHLSIPGRDEDDRTRFSATKRAAERVIASSSIPFVILRPGFVVARAAYGGSALIRALAALPFDLPEWEASRPFAATDVTDIARTIALVSRRWCEGEQGWNEVWDIMERRPTTVGGVVDAFRHHLGGPTKRLRLPSWLMGLGACAGDLAAHLGWSPPVRSTALAEMRRGVEGDPGAWIAATGIEPLSLKGILSGAPATIQDRWFARLYLGKALILASLVAFWTISGLIALTVSFEAAAAILTAHGFPRSMAVAATVATSLADILVGMAIAFRQTCRIGLVAGIGLSLFYMVSAAIITPAMWIEPLAALIKTGPAIVLMLVALAVLDER